jgi:hypothetical protein
MRNYYAHAISRATVRTSWSVSAPSASLHLRSLAYADERGAATVRHSRNVLPHSRLFNVALPGRILRASNHWTGGRFSRCLPLGARRRAVSEERWLFSGIARTGSTV